MVTASAWMIAGRWILRIIGALSTVILARLLSPADFGLIAMAMIVIGALQVLAEAGHRNALVRLKNPTPEHYSSAWTLGLFLNIAVFLLLLAAAQPASKYMEDERLFSIICLLAFRPLIQGFENIGTVDLQRNLDFEKDFKLMIYGKVSGFFITIFLAFVLRDYRALIAGTLLQAATVVCFSYFFSPFRPRIKFSKIREIWAFSFWSLATNIGGFFSDRVDQAIIAHELPAQHMGAYTVGRELGAMATEELVSPPVRALFAVYAQLSNDIAALRQHYLSALSFVAIAATSTSVGVSLVAGDAVYVLLGPKWEQSVPVVPWLALYAGVMGIAYSVNAVLLATGRAYANAWRTIVFTLVLLPFVIVGVGLEGIEGAAIARLAVAIVFAPAMLIYVAGVLQMPISALASVLWRPIVAASAMAATLLYFHAYMPELPLLRLGSEALAGAAVYSGALTVLWFISGRPAGAEATLIGLLKRLVSRDGRKGT